MAHEDALLLPSEAAEYLRIKERTLQSWRSIGAGPAALKLSNGVVRYRKIDLDSWLDTLTGDAEDSE